MADIYNVNADNIVGGPGRLVVHEYDGDFPDTIEDVMETQAPFGLKPGWRDLGATTDGIATSRGFDTEDFEVDQVSGAVDSDITSWEHTVETALAENTVENRQLALIGGTIIETPPVLGTATTLTGAVVLGATIINVTSAAGLVEGGYVNISEGGEQETIKINRVNGTTIYLAEGVERAYTTTSSVKPVTTLGTKRIGYGTVGDVPFKTYALISQKKDGTLYMAVIRKAKISGDEKEQTYGKEKRTLPLQLIAYPDPNASQDENVYYEIEQIRA